MLAEIQAAVNFVCSLLRSKVPANFVDDFGASLSITLTAKFEGHWHPEKPKVGSAYRSLQCMPNKLDPIIKKAADAAKLTYIVQQVFPFELTVWIDPADVCYRMGERGAISTLPLTPVSPLLTPRRASLTPAQSPMQSPRRRRMSDMPRSPPRSPSSMRLMPAFAQTETPQKVCRAKSQQLFPITAPIMVRAP